MNELTIRRLGRAGLVVTVLLTLLSGWVLRLAMAANEAGFVSLGSGTTSGESRAAHLVAVAWALLFIVLQLMAPLLLAFTVRARFGLRVAVCVCIAVTYAVLVNVLGLVGLLAWLRLRIGLV